jgi:hypothetical protein
MLGGGYGNSGPVYGNGGGSGYNEGPTHDSSSYGLGNF